MSVSRKVVRSKRLYNDIVRYFGGTVDVDSIASLEDTGKTLQSFDGPKGFPVIGNFLTYLLPKNKGRMHIVQEQYHKQYGPIFKEQWGPKYQLHTSDPEVIETILRSEQKYPSRPPFNSWRLYRHVKKMRTGLVTGLGDEWLRIREILNKKMLKPQNISQYAEPVGQVTTDLITRIEDCKVKYGDEELAKRMPHEFYKWSMESVGSILFDRRLGCLEDPVPERVQEFIDTIEVMLSSSLNIIIGETLHYKMSSRFWRKHQQAWDKIFEIGKFYTDEKLARIESSLDGESGSSSRTNLLEFMLANEKLTMEDVYVNATEILLSGVDTTSNSLCFCLYLLARNPQVLRKLTQEVDTVVGDENPTTDHFEQMSYLRSVIRESLRLFPVVTMNVRVLEVDTTVKGYHIPQDTLCVMNNYAAGRNEQLFESAEEFKPERWLRDRGSSQLSHHAFSSLPFGFGKRSCIGKRIANLELSLALTKICQRFHLEHQGDELQPYLRTLLTPGPKVPVTFVYR